MQAFQRDIQRFEKLNAQVLGISGDSLITHKKFSEQYGISFPLISDEKARISRQYGGGRVTYLVDLQGLIRFVYKGIPDNEQLLNELEKMTQ